MYKTISRIISRTKKSLLTRKNVIDSYSTYSNYQRVKSVQDDTKSTFIEVLSKQKHIFPLIKLLEVRSHSKL